MALVRRTLGALARFFKLIPEPLEGRLSAEEAERIGRRGIGCVMDYGLDESSPTGWRTDDGKMWMGRVPREALVGTPRSRWEAAVLVWLEKEGGSRLVWHVTTNVNRHRGGEIVVVVDDATGEIIEGASHPY